MTWPFLSFPYVTTVPGMAALSCEDCADRSAAADWAYGAGWYMESTMWLGNSSRRAIICILRWRARSRPLVRRCLAAIQRMWSSNRKRADSSGSGRAWTLREGLWMVIWSERLSSLSPVTSTSCSKKYIPTLGQDCTGRWNIKLITLSTIVVPLVSCTEPTIFHYLIFLSWNAKILCTNNRWSSTHIDGSVQNCSISTATA